MNWITSPWTSFDLETTGVDPENDRVVTSSTVGIRGHVEPETPNVVNNILVNPGVEIPEAATEVHKVTTEYAREHGMVPEEALPLIRDSLYDGWSRGPVVGFNLVYDLTLLDRELRRYGLGALEIRGLVIDAYVLDRQLNRFVKGKGMRRLKPTCARWGIELKEMDAHTSSGDALATARLIYKMSRRETVKHLNDDKLMENQKRWYREQTLSFADWKAREDPEAAKQIRATADHWPLAALPAPLVESTPPPF